MQKASSLWDSVGNTPLIRIKSLSDYSGCEIYGKAEFENPGGSVKDRAAKGIIGAAEKSGKLKPGSVIVEGTAGNTGIGLATLAAERGYKVIVCMPSNQAEEKFALLEAIGAEVRKFAPCPFKNPDHFYHQARRLGEEMEGAFWADQFENTANAQAHYDATAPEIWEQMDQKIDFFVSSVGTGGTFGGISSFLKDQDASVATIVADPCGSGVYEYVKSGAYKSEGGSITEGIGIMRKTANFARGVADDALRITDKQMMDMLFHVARHDGLFMGTSTALNLAAALKIALDHKGSGKRIVTILCDHGTRYASKILNPAFQKEKDLVPEPLW